MCGASDEVHIARADLHHWEEPPLSGESGSGTVFFTHCGLRCVYCQNRRIALGDVGYAVDADGLVQRMLELQKRGALNINFVTGSHYIPTIKEAVGRARGAALDLPIVWNTGSYESDDALSLLEGMVDVYLADFKYASPETARRYSHAADYPAVALHALDRMLEQVGEPVFDEYCGQRRMTSGVLIRHLILPGWIEESCEALRLLYGRYGDRVSYSIMNQYTPVLASAAEAGDESAQKVLAVHPELASRVSEEDYSRVLDFADWLGIDEYYWQEGGACEESFIPEFSGAAQDRAGL